MVNITINGIAASVKENTLILNAAKEIGIGIPTLCHLKDINDISACRICMVEVEGTDRLVAACSTVVEEGMSIHTDSMRARKTRRRNLRLILSQHDCHCPTCVRSGNCTLQNLAENMSIQEIPYKEEVAENVIEPNVPLVRKASKCIKCMRCTQVCRNIQTIGVWDVSGTGGRTTVDVSRNRTISTSDCTFCGQCITHCPTGALSTRDDTQRVFSAIEDPDIVTVVQVAPAVRAAWGEALGMTREYATPNRMVAALRRLGFDYVFDTDFTADLTVMEEGSEFVERFTHRDKYKWPLFTSCCPGWVRFLKGQYPELTDNLSTAKSPQQMFGALSKSFFAKKIGVDPKKIFCVSVMPCTAKKSECMLPTMKDAAGDQDVDVVVTTREFSRMLRARNIISAYLPEEPFDSLMGTGTGAGVIFGATGGVMDAALRTAYFLLAGRNPDADAFTAIRGMQSWKEATFQISGMGDVRVAVASGLGNARRLVEAILAGEAKYDFVEIMACPGGCSGGGGQPITEGCELAAERGKVLWYLDQSSEIRYSHENPEIQALYKEYLGEPLGARAHELLHTDHHAWDMPKG